MVAIRLGVVDNLITVEEIVRKAYRVYIDRIGKKPAPMIDDYENLIRKQLVHVIEEGNSVLVLTVLVPMEKFMLVENVAVHPNFHGRGCGRKLLDYADKIAKTRGFTEIRLYINEKMIENLNIYRHLGWREYKRRTEKGYRRIYMKKPL
jgi:ribosomal protein S18 acetylase RimI-like enzyme